MFGVFLSASHWTAGSRDPNDSDEIDNALNTFSRPYLLVLRRTIKSKKLFEKRFTSANTCKPLASFWNKTQGKNSRQKVLEEWTRGEQDRHFQLNSEKARALDIPRREQQLIDALANYRTRRNEFLGLEQTDKPMEILDVVKCLGAGTD